MGEQSVDATGPVADLSRLPAVHELLARPEVGDLVTEYGRAPVLTAVRAVLDDVRARGAEAPVAVPDAAEVVARAKRRLIASRSGGLTGVINATGVILHTNLGRAPLSQAARAAVDAAAGYTNVEYDLASGERGSRTAHVGALAAEVCGTEDATVVNNGAAGLLLVLAALATGRETIVSRGELIEIGGSYRLPELFEVSGSRLREVGTTNRTRIADYRAACSEHTGLLLKVHPSNYRIEGFTESAGSGELAALAGEVGIPFVYDLGSGLLADGSGPLAHEPSVASAVSDGADLVVFSGDKLLGGPQAGIVAGRRALVQRCRRHPLARALRIDKLQRAALEATLEAHLRAPVPRDLPTWAMLTAPVEELRDRAARLADEIGEEAAAAPVAGVVGGGSMPGVELPSWCVALTPPSPTRLAARLRAGDPPVVVRIEDERLLVDLRTVPPSQDGLLADLLHAALH